MGIQKNHARPVARIGRRMLSRSTGARTLELRSRRALSFRTHSNFKKRRLKTEQKNAKTTSRQGGSI